MHWIPACAGMTEGGRQWTEKRHKERGPIVSWGVPPDPHPRDLPLDSLRLLRFARNDDGASAHHNDRKRMGFSNIVKEKVKVSALSGKNGL
jgi:hypothetical protein